MVNKDAKAAAIGFSLSSLATAGMAGAMLAGGMPLAVVLPTAAPVWTGMGTVAFMVLKD